jgi:DNA-binding winged helix-turn-helix (wHTH) protein/tetratricopeptide (TPR) repeat protein
LIDGWFLDERERSLIGPDGTAQRLDRSAYSVLHYLLLHAGEVCTHDELMAAGWPGRVVTGNSVAKCVGRLRRALGDEAGLRLRIVHGYGYRLLGRVAYRPGQPEADHEHSALGVTVGAAVPYRPDWTLVDRLGRGGSGDVLAASSAGAGPDRAYKFARGVHGLRALKREVALHQYLAAEHPELDCVMPLVDWNLERAPFFVATTRMVDGTLAQWAAGSHGLEVMDRAERLLLVIAICEAVAQLHAADVAHRDLKPENIYPVRTVESALHVRLGDLGAGAGLLPPGMDALGIPLGQATRAGTDADPAEFNPERYHAPEVLAGAVATSRADVYALAVIAFQILTADFRRALTPGWEQLLDDPLLCADLAAAAHLDPARRMGSAAQLAHRLRTLEARRELQRQREQDEAERRDARRREAALRRKLGVAAVVAVSALAALWVSVASMQRAETAQREAERQATHAAAVRDFMSEALLQQADPYTGGVVVGPLLKVLERAAGEVETRFADDPGSAGAVYQAVANAVEGHGKHARAADYSRRAIAVMERSVPRDVARLGEAWLGLCRQYRLAGRIDDAVDACRRGTELESVLPDGPRLALRVEAAKLLFGQGRCVEAVSTFDALLLGVDFGHAAETRHQRAHEEALWFRALCEGRLGRFSSARADFERLLAALPRTRDPGDLMVAWVHMDYAESLVVEGDFVTARVHLESAEPRFVERLGPDHVDSQHGHYHRARMALWSGDATAAVSLYRRTLDVWERDLGPTHIWALYTRLEWLWARAAAGDLDGVRRDLPQAREVALAALGTRMLQRGFFAETWARIALLLDDRALARQEIERARQDSRATVPDDHPRHAVLDCLAADLSHREGDASTARQLLASCDAGLAAFPPNNYRRRWAADVAMRINAELASR